MIAFLLFLVIAWIILGIIGFVVHGLFWLFVIACVLFVLTLIGGIFQRGRRSMNQADEAHQLGHGHRLELSTIVAVMHRC